MGKDLDKIAEEVLKYRELDSVYQYLEMYYSQIIDQLINKARNGEKLSISYGVPRGIVFYLKTLLDSEGLNVTVNLYDDIDVTAGNCYETKIIVSVPEEDLENSITRIKSRRKNGKRLR